ncbi:MAG: endonuclease [Oscillospiraceae bacterium]|nr:endonuclease [Oscillospiraceae bacterium]
MKQTQLLAIMLSVLMTTAALSPAALPVSAAPALPDANTEVRHAADAASLPASAAGYYTGDYTYEKLSALKGASDTSTSLAATKNNPLYDALHTLMADTQTFQPIYKGYAEGAIAYYWKCTDAAKGTDNFIGFYTDIPYVSAGDTKSFSMEREHIWPKNRASFNQLGGGADLHHLRPSVSEVNQAKSNYAFGNVNGVYDKYTSDVVFNDTVYAWVNDVEGYFECKDDVKGDVARILLYIYSRWEQPNLYSDVSKNDIPTLDSDDTSDTGVRVMKDLDTLLQWMEDDPVDTWEMQRNDSAYAVQGNRNVFIDYPELAWKLFGREIPEHLQTPTHAGCHHDYKITAEKPATCLHEGSITRTCRNCGAERILMTACTDHIDKDSDQFCDVCDERLTHAFGFQPSESLHDGDHVVFVCKNGKAPLAEIYNQQILSADTDPAAEMLYPKTELSLFYAKAAEGGFYLMTNGSYLTTNETGSTLSYTKTPTAYSIWNYTTDEEGYMTLVSVNAEASNRKTGQSGPGMLEIYNDVLQVFYTDQPGDELRFRAYVHSAHASYDEPDSDGKATCVFCGTEYLAEQKGLGDLNEDGIVNASDAALILIAAASIGAEGSSGLNAAQEQAADVNGDGIINASDAAIVLIYAAAAGAGQHVSLSDYIR